MKRIGIIGGMGPLATSDLYKKITLNTKADRDQDQVPVLIDSNTAIPDRTAYILGGGENPVPEMKRSIDRLAAGGADFLIMPCNTAHFFYDELTVYTSLPILHVIRLTAQAAAKKAVAGAKSGNSTAANGLSGNSLTTTGAVGLLATDGTLQSGIYAQVFAELGVPLVQPQKHQPQVMEFIYEGIKKNNLAIGIDGLFAAVKEMETLGASTFILGCTELSAATDYYEFDHRFIDPLLVLARASIELAGGVLT